MKVFNLFKSILTIVSTIFILGLILALVGIYIWGMPGMGAEVPGNKLTEVYLTQGEYSIGKQKFQYNICNKNDGCVQGKVLGAKQTGNDISIYIDINIGTIKSFDESKILDYAYNLYKKSQMTTAKNLSDIPKYGILSNGNLQLYSENSLNNLPIEQQNIFKELENTQEIVLNGVKYK